MKTTEMSGAALDWAVARCEAVDIRWDRGDEAFIFFDREEGAHREWHPSTDWGQGGPIIECYEIDLKSINEGLWRASNVFADLEFHHFDGPTPLIAAMRCLVTSKLGEEVEVPEDLLARGVL